MVEVTQADREAAEPFRRGIGGSYDRDMDRLAAAFAKHRTDAVAREGDLAAFGASDAACHIYPDEDQQRERAAFCQGAAVFATHQTPPPTAQARVGAMREALEWLTGQRNLGIHFYQPVYGDDDDQSREWRVERVSGPINDREWDIVGRGDTVEQAICAARAALTGAPDHG